MSGTRAIKKPHRLERLKVFAGHLYDLRIIHEFCCKAGRLSFEIKKAGQILIINYKEDSFLFSMALNLFSGGLFLFPT